MINDIVSTNGSLIVHGDFSSGQYVSAAVHDPRAMDGDVRYNNDAFEVYASGNWCQVVSNVADVSLKNEDVVALTWAKTKMLEEEIEKELMDTYPALKKAKENFNTIKALVENDN